jgi:hypothetical protein
MANKSDLIKAGADGIASIIGDVDISQRPNFIPEGDKTGTEGISADDIRLPRLAIAQGLSPQVIPGDSEYIDGLRLMDMFNDNTKEIYGKGPLYFIAVRRDVRCIEFIPRTEGGGVRDLNVPRNDPRVTQWREVEVDGVKKRLPPVATLFNEYVVLLLKRDETGQMIAEPIVISIKNTNKFNRRAMTDLNGFIKMHASKGAKSVPIYGVIYSIESKPEKNDKGTFGTPVVRQVGYVPPSLESIFHQAEEYAKELEGKNIIIEREPGDETDFDTATMDGEVV